MMRHFWLIFLILIMSSTIYAQDEVTTNLLNYVNETRQTVGINPLVFNSQLQAAAQNHSDDMAQRDELTHVGSDGSQFWERMQSAGYAITTGAENVLSRSDTNPESVFNQWFNSDAHRLNMLNSDYVEIGIAYAQAASGRYYFTMVLGTRTDFIAPTSTLIPTITPTFTAIPTTASITVEPTTPAVSTPIPTQASALATNTPQPTVTEFVPPEIRLTYNDTNFVLLNISGRVLNLGNLTFESNSGTMVASQWNIDSLSQPLSGFTNSDCLEVWTLDVDYLPPSEDCRTRHGWIAVPNNTQFWRESEIFTVRNGDDLVGICQVDFGICDVSISTPIEDVAILDPVTFGQLPDLRLEFSDSSFSLITLAQRTIDLNGLVFRSESGILAIEAWNTDFLTQDLSNFRNGDCLQTWTLDQAEQSPPDRCRIRHAWILVDDSEDFWRQTDSFIVEQNGSVIGRCSTNGSQCTISLSDNIASISPTQVSMPTPLADTILTAPSGFDVQLAITPESVTLFNTSSRDLDISGLVFQGTLGIFSATRWQIPELSTSLTEIPAGDCLQVWVLGATVQPAPDSCRVRHGWIFATQSEFFWIGNGEYEVWDGNLRLATCEMNEPTCNFNLP